MYHCMRLQVKQARLDSALELCGVVLTFFDMLFSINFPASMGTQDKYKL